MRTMRRTLSGWLNIILVVFCAIGALFGAQVETREIPSHAMGRTIPARVILPAAYPADTSRFPVLYLLHGYGGNYRNWDERTGIRELADRHGIIIVCPDGGADSWYLDSPREAGSQYETHVAQEVPQFIDRHYRTVRARTGRAISGLSMGGHGALLLAFRHGEIFGAAGSMSGGVDLRPFADRWGIAQKIGPLSEYPERWRASSVIENITRFPPDTLALIIDCGVADFFLAVNRVLHQKLLAAGIPHDYIERPGGHSWGYWANAVKYQMLFFAEYFRNATDRAAHDR